MLITDEKVPGNSGAVRMESRGLSQVEKNVKRTFDYKNNLQEKKETRIALWLLTT